MSDYVSVLLNTDAYWQPPYRSVGNGCLIGNGGPNAPQKFWLTRPSGSDFDLLSTGSDLRNSVTTWYKQRNARNVLCINTGSINAMSLLDEVPRPMPTGLITDFFVPATPVQSIDDVTLIIGTNTYDLPAGGYTYTASQVGGQYTGEVVITPAPPRGTRIYVDYTADALPMALRECMSDDVQIVVLCNNTTLTDLQMLADHVDLAFASNRFRMGSAMLPQSQTLTGVWRNWSVSLSSENMMLCSHNSSEDAAAGYAGMVSGLRVFDDPIKGVVNLDYSGTFTDNERLAFEQAQINCLDNYYTNELGLRSLQSFTLSPSTDRQFIDFVRTYQDLMWRLISTLDSPNVIGKNTFSRAGIAKLKSDIEAAFLIPLRIGEIESIVGIDIPLESIIRTPYNQRTAAERTILQQAKALRILGNITVSYEAISYPHKLELTLQVV